MLGHAPILDFDGTLARLAVDWAGLRRRLQVERIDDLWDRSDGWDAVEVAEVEAAETAAPIAAVVQALSSVRCFAVLTSNHASAVTRFLDRFPDLRVRLATVVGREELGGPKTDFARFERGLQECVTANNASLADEPAVYVGDSRYELDFARALGLRVVDVKDLDATRRSRDS